MMTMARAMAMVVVSAALVAPAHATDRYFPDSFAASESGRFRIDAKSPDNAAERQRPFASNFVYTLTDTTTKKVVWERKQPMSRSKGSSSGSPSEPSPVRVFVNDSGMVAARTSWDTLILLDAADGRKRAEAEVLKSFPDEERGKYVSETTAGPMWAQESDWFFLTVRTQDKKSAALYFVVRPYWNHRLIFDASTGKRVDLGAHHAAAGEGDLAGANDEIKRLLTATIADEKRRALSALAAAPAGMNDEKDYALLWRLRTALQTVGFLHLAEAEPQLRAMEKQLKTKDPWRLSGKVREALRAIGKTPVAGCGVLLYPMVDKGNYRSFDMEHPFNALVPVEARSKNAGKVAAGMTVRELTDLMGCPDANLYDDGQCYDYDIDAEPPYTIRIYFDGDFLNVEKVRTIKPLAFLHDPPRMREY